MRIHYYYRFLTCTFIGALGEYMALITLSWYLLETYNDISVLGKVLSFRILPRFFMGFVGGYLADLFDRKKMMVFVYGCIMLISLFQTILITAVDQPAWYALAGMLFLRSIADGAEPGIRNAVLPYIVDRPMIAKAVGYYSTGLNLAAILAPMLATFLMLHFEIITVFWIDWILQIPSFIILFSIPKMADTFVNTPKKTFVRAYKEAFLFIYRSPVLIRSVIVSIAMMITLFPFGAMLSIYVKEALRLGVKDYGYMSAAEAGGAVLSGILLYKIFHKPERKIMHWYGLSLMAGFCLILLSLGPNIFWTYLLIFIFGLFTQLFRSYSRVIFHENTPDRLRGKVMSIIISDSSFISIGLLVFTFLAEKITIVNSLFYMGICTVVLMLMAIILRLRNVCLFQS